MKRYFKPIAIFTIVLFLPMLSFGQGGGGIAGDISSLQGVLDNLYAEMLPMCSQLTGVGRGIAGFAATWYIAARVWRHIANAEPVDFYPLFRPFVLGFCILIFPSVIAMVNGILQPTVTGTSAMVQNSDKAIAGLLKLKEDAIKNTETWKMYVGTDDKGDQDRWYKYTHNGEEASEQGMFESIGSDIRFAMEKQAYKFKNSIKQWMSEILQVLFQAAALCINTLRTFQLIVLAILGPLVFGIAVFDGFQHTLTAWLGRYMNIFLWLPVANIFGAIIGKIQEQMLKLDLSQIQNAGDTFFSTADTGYLIFMIIGIVGYFTVPSVANSIIHASGMGSMLSKVTRMGSTSVQSMTSGASNAAGNAGETARSLANIGKHFNDGYSGKDGGSGITGSIGRSIGSSSAYLKDKLSGKSSDKSSD